MVHFDTELNRKHGQVELVSPQASEQLDVLNYASQSASAQGLVKSVKAFLHKTF